ncbi:geranylgeranyl reductase family protein [Desulfocurvibacter africanus PCS]|uniref:Geranylgeranyl reductase family protein n=1 Tax=Desulfocurvibacter africanus PCS TaxID=1262666 RepID=M5PVP1_DESAF|nr:geranylgeranyl reductase family protein [Desulfocurvibacter africanus]EMG38050.1 geranylgeranyl reductase family protein [Desulfocurvibacter africanus PCS]
MYDLIVIGAGPAGSMAARQAAQSGLKTLLLDKDQFPRAKPCGGGLTLRALEFLASAGLRLPASVIERPLMGARITIAGRSVEVRKPWPVAVTVLRERFDSLLLHAAAAAGARVELGRRVEAVTQDRSHVAISTGRETWSGRLAVIAEGASGRLKRVVRPINGELFWICVSTDSTLNGQVDDHGLMHIETGLTRTGYAWIFPRRESASVGLSAMPGHCRGPRRILGGYLGGHGFDADLPLRGHIVPLGGLKRRLAAGRVLLAGDAGGFADAFTCEGIAYALLSGAAAGHAAALALAHGNLDKDKDEAGELGRIYMDLCRPLLRQLRHSLLALRIHGLLPASLHQAILLDPGCLSAFLDVAAAKRGYPSFLAYIARRLPGLTLKSLRGA